jgi:hypothetical protein
VVEYDHFTFKNETVVLFGKNNQAIADFRHVDAVS